MVRPQHCVGTHQARQQFCVQPHETIVDKASRSPPVKIDVSLHERLARDIGESHPCEFPPGTLELNIDKRGKALYDALL